MGKKRLIVVHGMGTHTEATVKKEVVDAFESAFNFYPSLKGKKAADSFDIIPVAYNSFFDDYRKQLAEQSGKLAEQLTAVDGSVHFTVQAVKTCNDIETELGQDSFFTTHWLDVLLYYLTLLCEPVRLKVIEAVADSLAEVDGSEIHVLGHSLGTAVLHDALAKAYGPENIKSQSGRVLNLSTTTHRLGGVHMVANVSRALQTFVAVGSSVVRPGELGCTSTFIEYRHRLDPIAKIRQFNPTDNEGWVTHDVFKSAYQLIEPTTVSAANVHGLGHYLLSPMVHLPMFRLLFGFRPNKTEQSEGEAAYAQMAALAKAQALQAAFGDLHFEEKDELIALLKTAIKLRDMVLGFGESF